MTLSLSELNIPSGWMIGPRSHLVDRIVADLELIFLPEKTTGGGQVTLRTGHHLFTPPKRSRVKMLRHPAAARRVKLSGCVMDLRAQDPENWAHFLNIHLALVALAARHLELGWESFTVILPARTPGHIRALVDRLGLTCHYLDNPVEASGIQFAGLDWTVIRGERCALLQDPDISPVASALSKGQIPLTEAGQGARLFLSRKGTRALENEAEIEALLAAQGFVKIYAEDLEVGAQIATIMQAREIVAVHGAALAPILYRSPAAPPMHLVELFPVGHITNVYRAVAAAIGARWCGVRGMIAPEHLAEIYRLDRHYTKHSLQSFRVDPSSVERALEIVRAS